jgi:hypothetical protein
MKPKTKILALLLGLNLPHLALTIMEHPLPTWSPYFFLSYFLATIISAMVLSRRISINTQAETVEKPQSFLRWISKVWSGYLVAFGRDSFFGLLTKQLWAGLCGSGSFLLVPSS